jgi:hypothetical protein
MSRNRYVSKAIRCETDSPLLAALSGHRSPPLIDQVHNVLQATSTAAVSRPLIGQFLGTPKRQ